MSTPVSSRNLSFDRLRGIGAVMVVLIHAPPLLHSSLPILQDLGWLVRELCQLAVPCFFLLSGLMMGRKWRDGREGWNELSRTLGRLGTLYIPWFLLFLILDGIRHNPHSLLVVLRRFAGFSIAEIPTTGYHLWFLPALAMALALCWSSLKFTGSIAAALVAGYGMFGIMYVREILMLPSPWGMVATEGINLSLACVATGVFLGSHDVLPSPRGRWVAAGVSLLVLEGWALRTVSPGKEPAHIFQILRIIAPVLILLYANSRDFSLPGLPGKLLDLLGRHALGIYVSHLAFLELIPFDRLITNGFLRDNLVRWPTAIACGILLSVVLGRARPTFLRQLVS